MKFNASAEIKMLTNHWLTYFLKMHKLNIWVACKLRGNVQVGFTLEQFFNSYSSVSVFSEKFKVEGFAFQTRR